MPLQNRVTPASEIVLSRERGTFMGNRGILHDDERRIGTRRWRGTSWIVCTLAATRGKRRVMAPGRYTELFFTDEASALAAGHRPCAECRREAFRAYAAAWAEGTPGCDAPPRAPEIDRALHGARLTPAGRPKTFTARLDDLPHGSFVRIDEETWLLADGRLLRWTFGGYDHAEPMPLRGEVEVLTPMPTLGALRAGYRPVLHPSATS